MKNFDYFKPMLLCAFIGLSATACNDDNGQVPMPKPEEAACRLQYFDTYYGVDSTNMDRLDYSIEYNAQGYASRIVNSSFENDPGINIFIYNSDNQIIREESSDASMNGYYFLDTFEYTNGLLTTTKSYSPGEEENDESRTVKYKYDNKKRLIEERVSEIESDIIYIYTYDNKDNLTKREEFKGERLISRQTYEDYDNNPTPYAGVKGLPGIYFNSYSNNNPRKSTWSKDTNSNRVIESSETSEITYTYTYNNDGCPTQIITQFGINDPKVEKFYYYFN